MSHTQAPSKEKVDAACEFFGGLSASHRSGQHSADLGPVIEHAAALVTAIGQRERAENEPPQASKEKVARPRYCYLCRATCTQDDYCHGCKKTICKRCDKAEVTGQHEPEAHRL